jgi:hypothetical protein
MLIHSLTHVIAGMSHDLIESSVDLVKGYCVARLSTQYMYMILYLNIEHEH